MSSLNLNVIGLVGNKSLEFCDWTAKMYLEVPGTFCHPKQAAENVACWCQTDCTQQEMYFNDFAKDLMKKSGV